MGWRLSSANQRKIQTDSQGIVCRGKPRLATGLPIITATAAASAGRAPRAHSTARAARRRRTRLGDGENVPGEPQSPGGGEQPQPARDCVSPDQIASGSASRSSPQAPIGAAFAASNSSSGMPRQSSSMARRREKRIIRLFAHRCGLRIMPAVNSRAADAAFVCRKLPIVLG